MRFLKNLDRINPPTPIKTKVEVRIRSPDVIFNLKATAKNIKTQAVPCIVLLMALRGTLTLMTWALNCKSPILKH